MYGSYIRADHIENKGGLQKLRRSMTEFLLVTELWATILPGGGDLPMPVFWKTAVAAAGFMVAFNGVQDPQGMIARGPHNTLAAARNAEATSLIAALSEIEGVSIWRAVLSRSGYAPAGVAPVTVIVPSDAAFASGDEGSLVALVGSGDTGKLAGIIRRTIIAQPLDPATFAGRRVNTTTLAGTAITVDASGQSLTVGDAEILAVRHASDGSIVFIVDHLPVNGQSPDADADLDLRE
jgi:uncharacterized surface protein with fasciclin (FAS1) repeats